MILIHDWIFIYFKNEGVILHDFEYERGFLVVPMIIGILFHPYCKTNLQNETIFFFAMMFYFVELRVARIRTSINFALTSKYLLSKYLSKLIP